MSDPLIFGIGSAKPRILAWLNGRHGFRRLFDTMSVRMILIILLSSVPLAILSGVVSWHSYVLTADAGVGRTVDISIAIRSQALRSLQRASTMSQALADLGPPASSAQCRRELHLAASLQHERNLSITLSDASGRTLCSMGPDDAQELPSGAVAAGDVPIVRHAAARGSRLLARMSRRGQPGSVSGSGPGSEPGSEIVVTTLWPLGWTRETLLGQHRVPRSAGAAPVHAWLLGPDNVPVPACLDCAAGPALDPAMLASAVAEARASPGEAIRTKAGLAIWQSATGSLGVLALTRPTDPEIRALSVFIIRVIAIVLLLGLGLMGVSLGANMLVVAPLKRLTQSVTDWRRAGGVRPDPRAQRAQDPRLRSARVRSQRMMPTELRELSRAFRHATHSLAQHERELREAEARQELLIKEIHHRVKNNLQIIASLLNLQANRIRQPEARAEFASARDRVRALATLHRYLYSEGDLQTLNMRSFLQELCSQLFAAIGEKQGHRIQLHIEAQEIAMVSDQAVPLALVVTEAVSNAVKYAFPGGRSGHVRVSLIALERGTARLEVADDGVGIPAGRADTETGVRDGLGIQLIRGFARQLAARLEVDEGRGTRYTLTFPLHRQREPDEPGPATADAPESQAAPA